MITKIQDINIETEEGKLLVAALNKILIIGSDTYENPYQILKDLNEESKSIKAIYLDGKPSITAKEASELAEQYFPLDKILDAIETLAKKGRRTYSFSNNISRLPEITSTLKERGFQVSNLLGYTTVSW